MKKYLLNQLTQISSWVGVLLMVTFFWLPREYFLFIGLILFFANDEWLRGWILRQSPFLKKFFDELEKELEL